MKPTLKIGLAAIAVLAVAAIAYWLGARGNHADSGTVTVGAEQVRRSRRFCITATRWACLILGCAEAGLDGNGLHTCI
jgi:hypothetical protein